MLWLFNIFDLFLSPWIGGRIIDNWQIDNLQIVSEIDNLQIDNLKIDNLQIDNQNLQILSDCFTYLFVF